MAVVLSCNNDTCLHNRDGGCTLKAVSIEMKFGEFRSGERVCYPTCQECEETEDGDD